MHGIALKINNYAHAEITRIENQIKKLFYIKILLSLTWFRKKILYVQINETNSLYANFKVEKSEEKNYKI